ncbi:MAG: 6-phosphofructokinase [Candidatus Omnitrophica bacterium]|nr:6-phosphofructokinase [Candidatus Omnitrophota bacterium]
MNKRRGKKIAVLTSGGDCAGMNAAIRAVVRTAEFYGMESWGIFRGYEGLIDGHFKQLTSRSVSGIINLGGTILKTSRSLRFRKKKFRRIAVNNLRKRGIEALVVLGGNGSYRGAKKFSEEFKFQVIGIPSTIDNDIAETDLTLGADTAVNVALDAIDKIRDTATSMERIFVVEVMGRDCGYIALETALAGGAENVLVPERRFSIKRIAEEIAEGNMRGKISWIIIVAEGKAKAQDIAQQITKFTSLQTRVTVLGHIQRGGRPTATDRILGARFGSFAVELLQKTTESKAVGIKSDKLVAVDFSQAISSSRSILDVKRYFDLVKILT